MLPLTRIFCVFFILGAVNAHGQDTTPSQEASQDSSQAQASIEQTQQEKEQQEYMLWANKGIEVTGKKKDHKESLNSIMANRKSHTILQICQRFTSISVDLKLVDEIHILFHVTNNSLL